MPGREIFPTDPPRHDSRAARFGPLVFLAGLCSRDPKRNDATVGTTLEEQCAVIFTRISDTLAEAGTSLANVVKVTVFLRDIRLRADLVPILQKHFATPLPPITIVEAKLVREAELIEIDVTAAVVDGPGAAS